MRWNGSQLGSEGLLLGIWLEGLGWYVESCDECAQRCLVRCW